MSSKEGGRDQNHAYPKKQPPHSGEIKSSENQALPSAWDLLERKARAYYEFPRGRMSRVEYDCELDKVERLKKEVDEKGTNRDKHILDLLFYPGRGLRWATRELERVQHFRSMVEPLSDKEIAECVRKQKEEIEAFQREGDHTLSFHPSVGNGEIILTEYIAKKGERG